ncbi:MAG TPA: serine hydrolase [Roseiflexaceae bacterium]|nr:serine hydrolase [Roseiflexaceae bacterium]
MTEHDENPDACVRTEMARWTVPGIAVGVLHNGETSTFGYGVASLETGFPVRPDTLFQVGSISKLFVATMIMQLVEQGRVELDAPIVTYLPDLRLADAGAQQTITLRHLLTHTSGLYGDCFDDHGWGDDALTNFVASFHKLRQITAPGELWTYCNSGFGMAGLVIERVLDMPFEQAVRERIFAPLGMDHSFYFAHEAIAYPAAVGHTQVEVFGDAHEVARKYPLPRSSNPAGGIISNVGDLLRFAAFHMGDGRAGDTRLLTSESIRAMRQPQVSAGSRAETWGIGWEIKTSDGVQIVGHGGATNGFNARLTLVPERQFALAILTNSGRGAAAYQRIAPWALQHFCGLKQPEPAPVTLSDEELARYAGTYTQPLATVTMRVVDGGLEMVERNISALTGQQRELPPLHAHPVGNHTFMIDSAGQAEGEKFAFIFGDGRLPRFARIGGRLSDRVHTEN